MKNKVLKSLLFCLTLFLTNNIANAEIKLPKIFTDNMVFQQKTEAPIWGKAAPEKEVKITTSWNNQTYKVKAGKTGEWTVKVNTPNAGGPYSITISDGKTLILNNILIGEVWICSGQSNMEMPLAGWGKVNNYEREISAANYPNIRLLHVERMTSTTPVEDLAGTRGGWRECSPETVAEFSSVAYFFGRNLFENQHVPIGLINTSWGGTIAEAWTSGNSLEYMPDFKEPLKQIRESKTEITQKTLDEWRKSFADADLGIKNGAPVWAATKFNDSSWPEMTVPSFWEENGLPGFDGIVWFRKTVEIPAGWSGKELELKLSKIDDWDITYFNGVKVGNTNNSEAERTYKIPAGLVKAGKAVICVRVTDRLGYGGIWGNAEFMTLSPENGGKPLALAGKWKYKSTADFGKLGKEPRLDSENPNRPTVLFNAMINPLIPFAFQGAIWYQGEANANRAAQYKELLPLMIRDWRNAWGRDFPFYLVQLANFRDQKPEPGDSEWAELREAQLQTLHLDNTGMAVTIDIGEAKDIHPKNKQDVGLRLALNARAKTYNEKIPYSGPVYESYKIAGDKIHIRFSHAEGLKTNGGSEVKGFAVAGSDHVFHWADAVIKGNEVIVGSPEVKFPVAVRYAWADNPVCNLFNRADLPASPFRTDCWK
jgi:sialate O-acetylesterase